MNWRAVVAYLFELAGRIERDVAASTEPSAPAVTVGKVSLTGGQVRALYAVASHLVTRTASVRDAEAVEDIVIDAALSTAGPAAVLIAPAAEALAALVIEGIASGRIKPGAANEGQTRETPHSGRRA